MRCPRKENPVLLVEGWGLTLYCISLIRREEGGGVLP